MNTEKAFGAAMKAFRTEKGLSQEKLAHVSGLDRTFISLLERGRRQPSLGSLLTLAQALGVPASKLVAAVEKTMKSKPASTDAPIKIGRVKK